MGRRTLGTCKVDDCANRAYVRGFCHRHWELDRWKRAQWIAAMGDSVVDTVGKLLTFEAQRLKKILFVGDVHCPYENVDSWSLMMEAAEHFKPDILVVMGDLCDFYAVSSYSKDPRRLSQLSHEVYHVNLRLDQLDELGAKRKIFVAGNHEDRLERYLCEKAPALFDYVSVEGILNLESREYEYVPYKQFTQLGKLFLTHDVGISTRYAIFRAADSFKHSVVTGHTHRLQYVVEGDATGGSMVATSFGWLGDVSKVDYMHLADARRNWAQGFGTGYYDEATGYVYLVPIPIVERTCVVEGKLYTSGGVDAVREAA